MMLYHNFRIAVVIFISDEYLHPVMNNTLITKLCFELQ